MYPRSPHLEPLTWHNGALRILDQTALPRKETYLDLRTPEEVADAITALRVRGAPLIGVAAAFAMALAARRQDASALPAAAELLVATRPTAVNLRWAVERCLAAATAAPATDSTGQRVLDEALAIQRETAEADERMGTLGADLVPTGATVLTHCNTGSLATGGIGTALGVIKTAHRQGKQVKVLVDETRPLLQGARLTAWELEREGIEATLIVDGAAGRFLQRGEVTCVLVGADRIAANGDTANKIGTYPLAVVAGENGVPFYVVAPTSTIDRSLASGDVIPIEQRSPDEVSSFGATRVAPAGVRVANPAFDVTPARYVSAIITERGVARPPYPEPLRTLGVAPAGAGATR